MKIGIIDTHILAWYLEESRKLTPGQVLFMDAPENRLIIPTIVICETKYLIEKGRLKITFERLMTHLEGDTRIEIFALEPSLLKLLPTQLDIHDAIIVATYLRIHQLHEGDEVLLLTQDQTIRSSGLATIL